MYLQNEMMLPKMYVLKKDVHPNGPENYFIACDDNSLRNLKPLVGQWVLNEAWGQICLQMQKRILDIQTTFVLLPKHEPKL